MAESEALQAAVPTADKRGVAKYEFTAGGASGLRTVSWRLALWDSLNPTPSGAKGGEFEYVYTTRASEAEGSFVRRGTWSVDGGAIVCHIGVQVRITRHPDHPPTVSAQQVQGSDALIFRVRESEEAGE
eukprot:Hpha_TRINITY_DN19760_c0_g1::TRINITY_DN19760_c0_g1_i1::g.21820::m.21820